MNTFMISFLSVSVSGLCMAGIVVLLEKLLKNHLSFRFRYGLWLFVILRLLIPVSPVAGVVGTLFSEETWNPQPQTQLAAKRRKRSEILLRINRLNFRNRRPRAIRFRISAPFQHRRHPNQPGSFNNLPGWTI